MRIRSGEGGCKRGLEQDLYKRIFAGRGGANDDDGGGTYDNNMMVTSNMPSNQGFTIGLRATKSFFYSMKDSYL